MNSEKKLKCPQCNKLFKTKNARKEHVNSKHKLSQPLPRAPRRGGGAPMAVSARALGGRGPQTTMSGTDVLLSMDLAHTMKHGDILSSDLIVPGLFPRLSLVAQTFQKIRYNRIVVRIVTQIPSTTGGGYVAGFIADPADVVSSGEKSIQHLISQAGSVATKWWESATMTLPIPQSLYFTSKGVDVREYSPGSFVIACTGAPTQPGSLVVYVDWTATLSVPTLERPSDVIQEVKTLRDLYLVKGSQGLFCKKDGKDSANIHDMIEPYEGISAFELPYPISVQDGDSVANANVKLCFYLINENDKNLTLGTTATEKGMTNNALSSTFLLKAGTVVVPVYKETFSRAPLSTGPTREQPTNRPRGLLETFHCFCQLWEGYLNHMPRPLEHFSSELQTLSEFSQRTDLPSKQPQTRAPECLDRSKQELTEAIGSSKSSLTRQLSAELLQEVRSNLTPVPKPGGEQLQGSGLPTQDPV